MAEALKPIYKIVESNVDPGQPTKHFSISVIPTDQKPHKHKHFYLTKTHPRTGRLDFTHFNDVDVIRPLPVNASLYRRPGLRDVLSTYYTATLVYLTTLFLPIGYPASVTSDYTPYQIYDSLQAFASSIAGLISSRAVLQSLNIVGVNEEASSAQAATFATLLSIAQNTIANLTTILFAGYAAPRISKDVKFFRFLADVVNDTAFVLDLAAGGLSDQRLRIPVFAWVVGRKEMTLPVSPRVLALCTSSALRAVCGVAGGSSKAVLSSHFAKNDAGRIGDLNAKDASQETVVNLVGMWIGGVVVSQVSGRAATWTWMVGLLAMHLWCNWCAVRSVVLSSINRERAAILFEKILARREHMDIDIMRPEDVSKEENVFGVARLWRRLNGSRLNISCCDDWKVGVSFTGLFCGVNDNEHRERLSDLFMLFDTEKYILICGKTHSSVIIALKPRANCEDQLKAWLHATIALSGPRTWSIFSPLPIEVLKSSLANLNEEDSWCSWKLVRCQLLERGWDLNSVDLENGGNYRIHVRESA